MLFYPRSCTIQYKGRSCCGGEVREELSNFLMTRATYSSGVVPGPHTVPTTCFRSRPLVLPSPHHADSTSTTLTLTPQCCTNGTQIHHMTMGGRAAGASRPYAGLSWASHGLWAISWTALSSGMQWSAQGSLPLWQTPCACKNISLTYCNNDVKIN